MIFENNWACIILRMTQQLCTLQKHNRCIGSDIVGLQKMWITCSHLYLIVEKSELIWFCQPLTDIRLQIERLKNSDSVRYLGINLDKNFSFDIHFDKVVKRLSRHVFAVARTGKNLNRNVLIPYYRSFFKAKIRYCLLIYGCTSSKLRPICMVQRKLLKLLFF